MNLLKAQRDIDLRSSVMINVLFGGDVVGSRGCEFAAKAVYRLRGEEKIDIVIVNGENSADGNGITRESAEKLFSFADVITTGNHWLRRKEFSGGFDEYKNLLRPGNYPEGVQGRGYCILDKGSYSFAVVNIMGTSFMEPLNNPFEYADSIIPQLGTPNILVDFHGEATAEKKSMGYYLAGRVSAVAGTHTHVQTADETILEGHTGYITDAGMCGAENSVLGIVPKLAVRRQKFRIPVKFTESDAAPFFCGILLKIDEKCGKVHNIKRLQIR